MAVKSLITACEEKFYASVQKDISRKREDLNYDLPSLRGV